VDAAVPAKPAVTTTTYAILGLLALRPWTAYELTRRMEKSLRYYWPRAQSKLYEEPKKLVTLGWAKAEAGATGDRRRTTYRITRRGRRMLEDWLLLPGAGPELEHEALLKVALSDRGDIAGLRANLEAVDREADAVFAVGQTLLREFLAGAPTFSDRMHVAVLVWRYLWDFAAMRRTWARWALARCKQWPDAAGDPARMAEARLLFTSWLRLLETGRPLPPLRPGRRRAR
jgi:PadR family transcriptional regulator AphA